MKIGEISDLECLKRRMNSLLPDGRLFLNKNKPEI